MTSNWGSWLICWRGGPFLLRNFNKLEKWANKNLMKFNKHKHKVLYLGRNKCIISPGWGQTGWVACLWERTWDPTGQEDTFPTMKTKCLLTCISKNVVSRLRQMVILLHSVTVNSVCVSGVLCLVLDPGKRDINRV